MTISLFELLGASTPAAAHSGDWMHGRNHLLTRVPFRADDAGSLLQVLTQWLLIALVGLLLAIVAIAAFVVVGLVLALLRDPLTSFVAVICRFLTWPLAAIARGAIRARNGLRGPVRHAFNALRYGPTERTDEEPSSWAGWDVLGPLIYLTFLLLLGAGDLYFMMQRFSALLFGTSAPPVLEIPIAPDLLSGVLWVVMVAALGTVLFDLHGATPVARPFHNIGQVVRGWLLRFVWICLGLSFLTAGLFWVWGQLKIDQPDNPLLLFLGVAFIGLFAVLLNIAVFLSGWAALAALGVFVALVLALARVLLWLVYGALELLVRLVNGLTRVVVALIEIPARVGRIVYNWATKFDWARNRFLFEIPPFEPPDLPGIDVDDLMEPASTGSSVRIKVPPMLSGPTLQDTVIAGLGDVGEQLLLDLIAGEAPKLGPTTVLAVGAVNDTLIAGDAQTTRLRVRNVSPQRRELRLATDGKASPARARQQLISDMVDRLIKIRSLARIARGHMLVLAELSAIDEASARVLGDVDRRVQGECVVLYSLLSHRGQRDAGLADAYQRVLRLLDDNALSATILVDPSGPFATRYGEHMLTQFAVIGLAGLFGAAANGHDNRSVAQVMATLGRRTGLVGLAFGGRRLIPLSSAQLTRGARVGSSFPEYRLTEIVAKAIEATEVALGEPSACALESSTWGAEDLALLYTVPLLSHDPRWGEFTESLRAHVAQRGIASSLLFVPGLGVATDGLAGRDFGVQVTALYSIPRDAKPLGFSIVGSQTSYSARSSGTNPAISVPSAVRQGPRDTSSDSISSNGAQGASL